MTDHTVSTSSTVPDGYFPVPICPDHAADALRLCVLVKEKPDPAAGHLPLLQQQIDAQVFLGCVIDAAQRVQRWVEIWVQDASGLAGSLLAHQEAINNSRLDERWRNYVDAFERLDEGGLVRIGFESTHPAPVFIDLAKRQPFTPSDKSGNPVALCQDDALLTKSGLPPFSTTLHRYLYVQSAGDESPFVSVTPDAPTNAATRPLTDILARHPGAIPLNPGGGLMMVRSYNAVGLESYVNFLGGAPWESVRHGRTPIDPLTATAHIQNTASQPSVDGRLFTARGGRAGRGGRLIETLYLKLRIIADAVQAVRDMVQQTRRPFLGLTAESFAVRFGEPAPALPFLWTARAVLCSPSDAIPIHIPASDAGYFLPARKDGSSIYRPPVSSYTIGQGTIRIPRILPDPSGQTILELTLTTHAPIDPAPNDLIRVRLNLADTPLEFYARNEPDKALAAGEWRFRTIQQKLSDAVLTALRAAEGAEMRGMRFELVPLLSTPCDLYSLAVLAIRALLVNSGLTHAVALDRMLSLARQLAGGDAKLKLSERIAALWAQDKRWIETLGPQQLTRDPIPPAEAFDLVPSPLWFDILAAIIRMLPGVGPDSVCRDFGDAPPGGVHRAFEPTLEQLNSLLLRVRSLIVVDWQLNREIRGVIAKCMERSIR